MNASRCRYSEHGARASRKKNKKKIEGLICLVQMQQE